MKPRLGGFQGQLNHANNSLSVECPWVGQPLVGGTETSIWCCCIHGDLNVPSLFLSFFLISLTDSLHNPYPGFRFRVPPRGPAHLHRATQVGASSRCPLSPLEKILFFLPRMPCSIAPPTHTPLLFFSYQKAVQWFAWFDGCKSNSTSLPFIYHYCHMNPL